MWELIGNALLTPFGAATHDKWYIKRKRQIEYTEVASVMEGEEGNRVSMEMRAQGRHLIQIIQDPVARVPAPYFSFPTTIHQLLWMDTVRIASTYICEL